MDVINRLPVSTAGSTKIKMAVHFRIQGIMGNPGFFRLAGEERYSGRIRLTKLCNSFRSPSITQKLSPEVFIFRCELFEHLKEVLFSSYYEFFIVKNNILTPPMRVRYGAQTDRGELWENFRIRHFVLNQYAIVESRSNKTS